MGRIASFTVLALLVLQCFAEEKSLQQVFDYNGAIRVSNIADDDIAAIWSVGAKVTLQYHENHSVMKLDNVKSALVNGHVHEAAEGHYKPIPVESEAILKPIIVHHEDLANITIAYEADDPIWSVNMKRGIANAFMYLHDPEKETTKEKTLYGDCNVAYKVTDLKDEKFVSVKTIDHTSCENSPTYDVSIAQWDPTSRDYNPITYETSYTYNFEHGIDLKYLQEIKTKSVMQHRSMPGVKSAQKTEQTKQFLLKSSSETFDEFDTSKVTVHANVTFDYTKGVTGDRDINNPKKTSEELIKEFNTNFEAFQTYLNTVPLTNIDKDSVDNISPMFDSLNEMDTPTLEKLSKDLFKNKDLLHQHIFLSYLPYLGSEASIKFIRSLVEHEDENLNDLLAIKILSTFPVYIDDESEELVKEMEPLMNLNVTNPQVKYAGILSFASLLLDVYENEKIDIQTYHTYVKMYYQNFVDAEEYEVKMIYLLGLINMAEKSFVDEMVHLCVNTTFSHHLRALAIHGFKPTMMASGEENFQQFWDVVQNHTEHLEIRVASLDLLLYSNISEKQFKTIMAWYHDNSQNLDEQHLANYLYTTVKALEKNVEYFHYLTEYATEASKTIEPIKSDIWTTGNYRMAFSDEDVNLGGSIQARFIANPKTNIINVGILSTDSFALSLNLGTYTAYIKTDGIPDLIFAIGNLNRDSDQPIKQLVDIIKKHGYKLKELKEDAHIEVVIFSNEKVVFGIHLNKDNIDKYAENPLFVDLLSLLVNYNSLSFPLMDYTYLVSDLGTALQISHDVQQFTYYGFENLDMYFNSVDKSEEIEAVEYNLKYRSIWTYSLYTEAYNPLEDTNLDNYKFVKDEKLVNIPYSFNLTDFVFKWKHTKDSFNWIQDHIIGVYIDEDKLHHHCSDCVDQVDIPLGNMTGKTIKETFGAITGIHFNITVSERTDVQRALDEDRFPTSVEIYKTHKTNSIALPFVRPVLLAWHACLYNTFIANDMHSMSIRSELYFEQQSESVFDLDFDVNDIKDDRDPISGEEASFTFALTNRISHNAEVLNHFNVTTTYKTVSDKPDGEAQPHIEHSYDIKVYYEDNEDRKIKACIEREILYPNRRLDKFSLEPVDPAMASTTVVFGKVENIDAACPSNQSVTITEIYTSTEKLKQHLESLEEYSKCKTQSKGLKYVPPTDDCLTSHDVISVYDACNIFVDFSKLEDIPQEIRDLSKGEFGLQVFEYKRLNETHVSFALDDDFVENVLDTKGVVTMVKKIEIEEHDDDDIMSLSASVVAYNDYDLQVGVSSACYITPNQIQTFYGKVVTDYNTKFGPDAVAFVECNNDTQSGLTIHRAGDNAIGFNFWSENNTIVASVHDGHAKVVYNGEPTKQTDIKDEDFKLYFLDNDVIYVTNGIVDIHYTTEYISLKAPTIYNNFICGLCSGDDK